MVSGKRKKVLTGLFLAVELVLYWLLLSAGGTLAVVCSYGSVVLCLLYGALIRGKGLILGGLACTVGADFFLVVCTPRQQLWGMVFFLGAQCLYAVMLHRENPNKGLLCVRAALILLAEGAAALVLRDKMDLLAAVSLCYYANLLMNIGAAFVRFRQNRLFAPALVLFLLCDTIIGLQVAAGAYLPIGQDSLLYRFLFMDFNLAWFFYLPSQVLIALSSGKSRVTKIFK